jgi:hypothetical protein
LENFEEKNFFFEINGIIEKNVYWRGKNSQNYESMLEEVEGKPQQDEVKLPFLLLFLHKLPTSLAKVTTIR